MRYREFSTWADTHTLTYLYLTCIRPHLEYQNFACRVCLKQWDLDYPTMLTFHHCQLLQVLEAHYYVQVNEKSCGIYELHKRRGDKIGMVYETEDTPSANHTSLIIVTWCNLTVRERGQSGEEKRVPEG